LAEFKPRDEMIIHLSYDRIALAALLILNNGGISLALKLGLERRGMILGNTLNGISLGLDRLGSELAAKRAQVEALLALGATRWEAARHPIQEAVRTGLIPIMNSMMVVGIVSLPGMMTGQILAGASPLEAVKYQIVIMFLIASGTALGTVSVVLLSYRRLFNSSHQFLYHLVKER
jgi:putative ABC transport system permease protein